MLTRQLPCISNTAKLQKPVFQKILILIGLYFLWHHLLIKISTDHRYFSCQWDFPYIVNHKCSRIMTVFAKRKKNQVIGLKVLFFKVWGSFHLLVLESPEWFKPHFEAFLHNYDSWKLSGILNKTWNIVRPVIKSALWQHCSSSKYYTWIN